VSKEFQLVESKTREEEGLTHTQECQWWLLHGFILGSLKFGEPKTIDGLPSLPRGTFSERSSSARCMEASLKQQIVTQAER
jgi:hypothetical protein